MIYLVMLPILLISKVTGRATEHALGPGFNRKKCQVKLVDRSLIHKRFLRRNRETLGPAIQAGRGTFPGHSTLVSQIFCRGDSSFPDIGVPAVAGTGATVANSLVSLSSYSQLLEAIGI